MSMTARTLLFTAFALCALLPYRAVADTPAEIDAAVNAALDTFDKEVDGGKAFLEKASGYLVFPRVIKVGVGVGGETGEGALRVGGQSTSYYRTAAGSIGFQLGAQAKSIVIAFMTQESLDKFVNSDGWKVGVDGSVALIDIGAGKAIDSSNVRDPVVGFVFGAKGLMYNLTLEGSKITKLNKS